MQERQKDRTRYFNELAITCEKYFFPYIAKYKKIEEGMKILEIGCGDGGNLLPFSQRGCETLGVDMSPSRIEVAKNEFNKLNAKGEFIASDIFKLTQYTNQFDVIICHDVFEHIGDKAFFLHEVRKYLNKDGIVFMSFPAWQMPFGGHQQICKSKVLSHLPFIHLLPKLLYKGILKLGHENEGIINELLSIKETRCPIELFEKLAKQQQFDIVNKQFYLINPHYEVKFGLQPRKLNNVISVIPWFRNFFTSSSFYILK